MAKKRPAASSKRRGNGGAPPGRQKPGAAHAPVPQDREPRIFRLGAVPGATAGRWIDAWNERMPDVPLELVPVAVADQREALSELDAALIRLPVDRDGLHVISLYDDVAVVVVSTDSALSVVDELRRDDLRGEVLIVPRDDVLGEIEVPGAVAPEFEPPAETADAIATIAAGVGVMVVPMSLARLHRRGDVAYRPLLGAPASTVALAWEADRTTPDVETFVGIVRGRTPHSSRA